MEPKLENISNSNNLEKVPSNRFREWFYLVPKEMRRQYVYNIWVEHRKNKNKNVPKEEENTIMDWQI